jgi:hypothetical protein
LPTIKTGILSPSPSRWAGLRMTEYDEIKRGAARWRSF